LIEAKGHRTEGSSDLHQNKNNTKDETTIKVKLRIIHGFCLNDQTWKMKLNLQIRSAMYASHSLFPDYKNAGMNDRVLQ
jgi:hypothetical protein